MKIDIRAALTKTIENENERIDYLVDVLQKAAMTGTELYMPNEGENTGDVVCTQVQLSNGMVCMPLFTSEERLASTIDTKAYTTNLENMALSLLISEGCDGIVIDIGNDGIILSHSLMQRIMEPIWKEEIFEESDTTRLNKAIHFATEMHAGSYRKGTTIPYICHPIEVMELLNEMNGDINLMIAGLLHDVMEDTDATMRQVVGMFGVDVGALVAGHSENKTWSWEERKRQCIIDTAQSGKREQMLVLADTISNQRSMLKDYRLHGDCFWKKFKRGKEDQCWYYSGKQDALWKLQFDPDTKPLYWQMVNDFKDIFVKYWLDVENHLIYQVSPENGYVFGRETREWEPIGKDVKIKGTQITRAFSETIEDAWLLNPEEKRQWKDWLLSDVEDPTQEEIAGMIIEKLKGMGVVPE